MLPLDIFKILNREEYENLKNYLYSFEKFLEVQIQEIEDKTTNLDNKTLNTLDKTVTETFNTQHEIYLRNRYYFSTIFKSNFRNTFLGLIISFVENILKDICFQYKSIKNETFDINDLKGNSDIEKAKDYLTKLSNQNIGSINKWKEIVDYKFVRNKIIHQNGKIPVKNNGDILKIKEIISNHSGITIKEQHGEASILITDRKFCENALNDSFIFINELIDILK